MILDWKYWISSVRSLRMGFLLGTDFILRAGFLQVRIDQSPGNGYPWSQSKYPP